QAGAPEEFGLVRRVGLLEQAIRLTASGGTSETLTFTAKGQAIVVPDLSVDVRVPRRTHFFVTYSVSGVDFDPTDNADTTPRVVRRLNENNTLLTTAFGRRPDTYTAVTVAQHWFGPVEPGRHTFQVRCEAPDDHKPPSQKSPIRLNVSHGESTRSLTVL